MKYIKMFSDREFYKIVFRLGLPVALQQLLTSSLALVDSLMVGSLGEYELAAVGMAAQYANLYLGIAYSIIAGGMLFFSQYWGAKDFKGIEKAAAITFTSTFVIALIFTVISVVWPETVMGIYTNDPYINMIGAKYIRIYGAGFVIIGLGCGASVLLRSTENVTLPLAAGVLSLLTNTFLNWVLIYGNLGFPELGVEGAAIASLISSFVNSFVMVIVSIQNGDVLMHALKRFYVIDWKFVPEFFKKAMPIILNDTLYAFAVLVINIVLGRQGADNLSALAIFRTVEGFVFAFYQGLASAASVLVGKYVGAGRIHDTMRDGTRLLILSPILTCLSCIAVYAARYAIISLYNVNEAVTQTVFSMLLFYIIGASLRLTNYHLVGTFRAGGDSKIGMYLEVGGIWLIGVPLVALTGLVLHAPFIVVFAMLYAEDLAKIGIEVTYYIKKKWIKPVTEEGKAGLTLFLAEKNRH